MALVEQYGAKKWSTIASHLPGRIGKQARERYGVTHRHVVVVDAVPCVVIDAHHYRWANHLDPNVRKGKWEDWEDQMIIKYQKIHGNKWAKIAKELKGRLASCREPHLHPHLTQN